ncbi:hypothetical protein D6745_00760 [Candidatus Woesearchaeota archaeon]|nr:MAG: hypothetical protein D6745_00760 [Candidatus Woesearchaeota archaeon]
MGKYLKRCEKMRRILTLLACLLLLAGTSLALTITTGEDEATIGKNDIQFTFLSQDPDPVEPGKFVDVRWKIENYGSSSLPNVSARIILDYPFSIDSKDNIEKKIGTLGSRQIDDDGVIVKWRVKVDENAVEGEENIKIALVLESGASINSDEAAISIESREKLLAVDKVTATPSEVRPGGEVNLTVELENLADANLENVQVKLDLDNTPFATIGSTTKKIIKKIKSGQTTKIGFSLVASAESDSTIHKIPLIVEYSDESGNDYNLTTTFGIKVYEVPKYILALEDTNLYKAGSRGEVVVSFSNIASDLNFVSIELMESPDYKIISNTISYLGNLESDDFETAEFKIYALDTDKKELTLNFLVSYRDTYNNEFEDEVPVKLRLYTKDELAKYGLEEQAGKTKYFVLLIIVLAVAYLILRRRKKRK